MPQDKRVNLWTGADESSVTSTERKWVPSAAGPYDVQLSEIPKTSPAVTAEVSDRLTANAAGPAPGPAQNFILVHHGGWFAAGGGQSLTIRGDGVNPSEDVITLNIVGNQVNLTANLLNNHLADAWVDINSSLSEVYVSPAANQFHVDYDRGFVEFNVAEADKRVTFTYYRTGELICDRTVPDENPWFGDGADGDLEILAGETVSIQGRYCYNNIRIAAGGILTYAGTPDKTLEICVQDTLYVAGTIHGNALATWNGFGGSGGGGGGGGGSSGGVGFIGTAGNGHFVDINPYIATQGGTAGAAGIAGIDAPGGAGGAGTAQSLSDRLKEWHLALAGSPGGIGGTGYNGAAGGSAQGNGGLGFIIRARNIVIAATGVISANGQAGANGADGAGGNDGGGGGEGGGGGGMILLLYKTFSNANSPATPSATGGAGGAGGAGPANGGPGGVGGVGGAGYVLEQRI